MNSYLRLHNLKEEEIGIIETIERRIKNGEKVTIQEVAKTHFTSTSSVVHLSKKLGFKGYSDMVFSIARLHEKTPLADGGQDLLPSLIDNYSEEGVILFCRCLRENKNRRLFILGIGFSDITADYFTQRASIYGFAAFRGPHFDLLEHAEQEPSVFITISKTGETTDTIIPALHAKDKGYAIVAFTSNPTSTLAKSSDILFVVEETDQRLIGRVPDYFFGKCILAFESLLAKTLADS